VCARAAPSTRACNVSNVMEMLDLAQQNHFHFRELHALEVS